MSNLSPLLEYVDRFAPSYKDLCGEYGKSLVSQAVDKGLLSIWNKKHCTLTSSGVAFLHPDSVSAPAPSGAIDHTEPFSYSIPQPPSPKRSIFGLLGAIAGLFVCLPTLIMYASELNDLAAEIKTYEDLIQNSFVLISLFLKVPARLSLCLACLFQWIGFCTIRRNFFLASGVLYFCAGFLWPADAFAVVVPLILAFVAYARTQSENH